VTETKPKNGAVTYAALKTWIPIIILIIACTTAFAVLQERVVALTNAVEVQTRRVDALAETFVEIKIQLAEIQKDVSYLRQQSGDK